MAQAMIGGLLAKKTPPHHIQVIDLAPQAQIALSKLGVDCSTQWPSHFEPSQVVLAVKPQHVEQVISTYQTKLQPLCLISLAAGITTTQLTDWVGSPTARIVRSMPNTPALVGQGLTGLFFNSHCTADDQQAAQLLFNACGNIQIVQHESSINGMTAISGSGPGYVFYFMEHLEKAALEFGFSADQARQLVSQTFLGAAALASNSPLSFSELRQQVTSPAGTTFAGLEILKQGHVGDTIEQAAWAAKQRAEALANKA